MKPEEAIKCIEDVLNSDYYYDESLGYQLTSNDFEWLEKTKEALKKQIPKKAIKTSDEYYHDGRHEPDYECPVCGNPYVNDCYCSCCEQKIDWSKEGEHVNEIQRFCD